MGKIDRKTAAKMCRKALAAAFNGVKFSVTSEMVCGGGTALNVSWDVGPTRSEVAAVTNQFKGDSYDVDFILLLSPMSLV